MPRSRFMTQTLLAATLTLAPMALFAVGQRVFFLSATPAGQIESLGDLGPLATIVTETRTLAAGGDLAGAERRISDFETAWDNSEVAMKPLNGIAWKRIDRAADAAFSALRAGTPDPAAVTAVLDGLRTTLANPY